MPSLTGADRIRPADQIRRAHRVAVLSPGILRNPGSLSLWSTL